MEREDQGRASEHIILVWSDQSKENQRIAERADKRKVRRLDLIGLDQSKHIGLDQEDQTKQSRVDGSKKSGEENSSLRKCPEG